VGISGEVEAGKEWTEPRRLYGHVGNSYQCIGLQDALESQGMPTRVQTAIEMADSRTLYTEKSCKAFGKEKDCDFCLWNRKPVFFNGYYGALRALEMTRKSYCLPKRLTACMTVTEYKS